MSDGYLILDDGGRIVQANPVAERILREAADGDSLVDGVVGSTAPDLFEEIPYTDRTGEYEGEFALRGDGDTRYISVEVADLEDDGFVIGRLLTLQDVTERVRTRNQLRREREELDTLFANISDPVVDADLDEDGRPVVQRVNPAFERVFGYDQSEVRGEILDDYIVPDDRQGEAIEVNDRVADHVEVREEVVRETADGEREFLLRVAMPDRQSDAAFALYTDITERKQRRRELEQQNERLDEFASMVSHDLRNPLNVAQEYLDIARRADDPEEFIDEAETSLDRMEAMIEDVLTLSREGADVAEPDTVELEMVAEMAWDNCDTAGATLEVVDSRRFEADPDRLLELFENLFRNAVEHGGTDVSVTVGSLDDGAGFYVADDGPGVPDRIQDSVFDHGVTTADDGTGFGLAIVDRIASAHGWETRVAESVDGGARFEFALDGG